MNKNKMLMYLLIFSIIGVFCFICSYIVLLNFKKNSMRGDSLYSDDVLSIEQKINNADEQYDLDNLIIKMPWLKINAAKWKSIILNDNMDYIPGPTEMMTIGLLSLDIDYLNYIRDAYLWYDVSYTIPSSLVTKEMEGYALKSSSDYKESYLKYLSGYNVTLYIDFDKNIVVFSY